MPGTFALQPFIRLFCEMAFHEVLGRMNRPDRLRQTRWSVIYPGPPPRRYPQGGECSPPNPQVWGDWLMECAKSPQNWGGGGEFSRIGGCPLGAGALCMHSQESSMLKLAPFGAFPSKTATFCIACAWLDRDCAPMRGTHDFFAPAINSDRTAVAASMPLLGKRCASMSAFRLSLPLLFHGGF